LLPLATALAACGRGDAPPAPTFAPVTPQTQPDEAPLPSFEGAWEFRRDLDGAHQRLGFVIEPDRLRWLTHGQVTREAPARIRQHDDGSATIDVFDDGGAGSGSGSGEPLESFEFIHVDGGIARSVLPAVVYVAVSVEEALRTDSAEFAAPPADDGEAGGSGEGSAAVEGSR
jgi:hypothetical protein